ncbi:MAG: hypothetical protein ACLSDQ_07255 [Adlercreutzia equolifaciens]
MVLSVAVLSGVTTGSSAIFSLSLENADVVAGLPAAAFLGPFQADREALTAGDVIFKMAAQSEGLIEARDFCRSLLESAVRHRPVPRARPARRR